jgi:hypothetical protein
LETPRYYIHCQDEWKFKLNFYCSTASSSSVTTLPSDENDEIGDFDDVPSPKKLKTKD